MDATARWTNAALAYGVVVWSWPPDAQAKLAMPRTLRTTAANKPGPRGDHVQAIKPLRREGRMIWPNLWFLPCFFTHGAAGVADTRPSLRPRSSTRGVFHASDAKRRETAHACPVLPFRVR
jgi:hypothetical protein